MSDLDQLLASGAERMNLPLDPATRARLLRYLALLAEWNRALNLTAITQPAEMVVLHLLDSLSVSAYIKGKRILDVGTGAGLPGVPLAIVHPDLQFTLLDSKSKKIRFVRQVLHELALTNCDVIDGRVEDLVPSMPFDEVIARALATTAEICRASRHVLRPGGRMLLMKGRLPDAELRELDREIGPGLDVITERIEVPNLAAERHLVIITLP